MNPIFENRLSAKADVFCLHNIVLASNLSVHGNFYCAGAIEFDPNRADSTCSLEVFGDLYVDNIIYIDNIIVHGNLHCAGVSSCELTVFGDIFIDETPSEENIWFGHLDTGKCYCDGNIHSNNNSTIITANVLVCNGTVCAKRIDTDSILSYDMNVTEDIQFTDCIHCLDTIVCQELWSPCFMEDVMPTIKAKKIISSNFQIGC